MEDDIDSLITKRTTVPPANKAEQRFCKNCGKLLVYNASRKKTPKAFCNLACNHAHAKKAKPMLASYISTPKVTMTDIEWAQLEALAAAYCTANEAAKFLHIHRVTLYDRLRAQKDEDRPNGWTWSEFAEEHQGASRANLRMRLMKTAMSDDSKMATVAQIFMAKNILGMGDRTTVVSEKSDTKAKTVEDIDAQLEEILKDYQPSPSTQAN